MKVVFLISCINSKSNGSGGHYYSLLNIANSLIKQKHVVKIIVIGNMFPLSFINQELFDIEIINIELLNIKVSKQKAFNLIKEFQPDIIHSYDRLVYYFGRYISKKINIPSFLTKCGGPNDKYFPVCKNIIFFSNENLIYYKEKIKYSNVNFYLISNRVNYFPDDNYRICQLSNKFIKISQKNEIKFLRICRIGEYYKSSAIQAINLIERLNNVGVKCNLTFIGVVLNQSILFELKRKNFDNVNFITENFYTNNAKELINFFDCVIGTGRSLMEASSKKKIILTPALNSEIPILLNKETFHSAFEMNFSERVIFKEKIINNNFENLVNILNSPTKKIKYQKFITEIFDTHFSIDNSVFKYEEIYKNSTKENIFSPIDIFLNFLLLLKNLVIK